MYISLSGTNISWLLYFCTGIKLKAIMHRSTQNGVFRQNRDVLVEICLPIVFFFWPQVFLIRKILQKSSQNVFYVHTINSHLIRETCRPPHKSCLFGGCQNHHFILFTICLRQIWNIKITLYRKQLTIFLYSSFHFSKNYQ